jgi:hypothetical protein
MSCKHVVFGVVLLGALASPIAAQTGPVSLDLSGAGLNLTILAPQGATAAKNADEPTEVEVRLLPNFALLVSPGKVATSRMKAELGDTWKPGTVGAALARGFKLVVDTPDALLYEVPVGSPSTFRVYAGVTIGEQAYVCSSDDNDRQFTRADAEAMLAACRSLKAK